MSTKYMNTDNLKEKFKHLQKIIIVPHTHIAGDGVDPLLLRNLGTACAKYFLTGVGDHTKIGVSSGNAVMAFIDALEELHQQGASMPYGCSIRPLSSKMSPDVEPSTQVAYPVTGVNTASS